MRMGWRSYQDELVRREDPLSSLLLAQRLEHE
jgi:hypothetical protein